MVDYTREIKATQASMPTPVVQQPTGNLVGDIANLATTGIQLFAQSQKEAQMAEMMSAQSSYEKKIAKGIMQYRARRQELVNSDRASPVDLRNFDNKFFQEYSDEEAIDIISGAKKITGTDMYSITKDLEARQQRVETELDEEAKQRFQLLEKASELLPYSPVPITPEELASMSDEELSMKFLQLKGLEAERNKQISDIAYDTSLVNNQNIRRSMQLRTLGADFNSTHIPSITRDINSSFKSIDRNKPQQVNAFLEQARLRRDTIPQQVANWFQMRGQNLTPEELKQYSAQSEKALDTLISLAKREDFAELGDNFLDAYASNLVMSMAQGDANAQQALSYMAMTRVSGMTSEPLDMKYVKAASKLYSQNFSQIVQKPTKQQEVGVPTGVPLKEAKDIVFSFYDPIQDLPPELQGTFGENYLRQVNGDRKTVKEFVDSSGFVTHVQGMAKGQPEKVFTPEQMDEALEATLQVGHDLLREKIPNLLSTPVQTSAFNTEAFGSAAREGESTYVLNPDLTISMQTGIGVRLPQALRDYNQFIKDFDTTAKKLGGTEEEIKEFRSRLLVSWNRANRNVN